MISNSTERKLQEMLPSLGVEIGTDLLLSGLGSFQLGGPVRVLIRVTSPGALPEVRRKLNETGVHAVLIGEGTNVLFSDQGWPGAMVRFAGDSPRPTEETDGIWTVSGAANLDEISAWAAGAGWTGLEPFTGIPGTVGGAVVGNAGAWGVQMEHLLESVEVVTPDGDLKRLPVAACGFSYRDSALKHGDDWVVSVRLRLAPGTPRDLLRERDRILVERKARHPDWKSTPCIGSFFKNLEPTSKAGRRQAAGWFLEAAGAKDLRVGGAAIFGKHANIPVKADAACTAADVAELARRMQGAVTEEHGLDLVREVRYLGRFPGEPEHSGWF